jgi:alginate biosynthesis protein AlgK
LGDINEWIGQIKTAYQRQRLSATDLLSVAKWLGSSEQRMPRQALDIYALFDQRNPLIVPHRAKLLYDYPAVGNTESLVEAVEILRETDPAQADLLTGRMYYDGDRLAVDPEKAEQYFKQARDVLPAADYFLGQIYWHGYLGRFEPQQAVAYLLSAARRGYTNADRVLAEIFSGNSGVLPNPVYAISFAELALAQEPSEKIQALYQQLLTNASEQQRQEAQQLKAAEMAARPHFTPENNQLIGSRQ